MTRSSAPPRRFRSWAGRGLTAALVGSLLIGGTAGAAAAAPSALTSGRTTSFGPSTPTTPTPTAAPGSFATPTPTVDPTPTETPAPEPTPAPTVDPTPSPSPSVDAPGEQEQPLIGSISGHITLPAGVTAGSGQLRVIAYDGDQYESGASDVDGDGNYLLAGLAAGPYRLLFDTDGLPVAKEWWNDEVSFATADPVDLPEDRGLAGIDVTLEPAGSISGTVTVDADVQADETVVTLYSPDGDALETVRPGVDGSYTLTGLPATSYKVGFGSKVWPVIPQWWIDQPDLDSATVLNLGVGENRSGVDATLATYAQISGQVTAPSGVDITKTRVTVRVYDASDENLVIASTVTLRNGTYSVRSLRPGSYKVLFTAQGLPVVPEWWDDRGDFASATPLTLGSSEARTGVNAALARSATITGRVTLPTGLGSTAPGISVTAHAADGRVVASALTANDGSYRLTGLPSGSYRVHFEAERLPVAPEWWKNSADLGSATPVTVWNQQVRTGVNAYLDRPSSISGTVTLPTGVALSDGEVRVEVYTANQSLAGEATVNADGTFTVTGLTAGTYRVFFDAEGLPVADEWWKDAADFSGAAAITLKARQTKANVLATLDESGNARAS